MTEDTVALVTRARDGDEQAWNQLIERYAPLVWSICRRNQLSRADTDDVGQTVWLLLVEQLGNLREPAALPGWLATTTQREALRILRKTHKYESMGSAADIELAADQSAPMIEHEIFAAEVGIALRAAFAELPPRCQRLLSMLMSDPPRPYTEISAAIPIPMGSIGPQRARCLDRLRRSRSLAAVLADDTALAEDTALADEISVNAATATKNTATGR
jgi:RNA polymerase sigma factor (sigma-70 family)